jgi:putative aminopeptidase FrvX
MFVHTPGGIRPGVMELPANWDQPDFAWPAGGAQAGGGLHVDVGARSRDEVARLGIEVGQSITVPKKYRPLHGRRANGRSFDDRVGCTALLAALWAVGPNPVDRDLTFLWATREEVGLLGALDAARDAAASGRVPDYVFAVDTFVSSDSPIESKRFADAPIGRGFVIRAVDNSNITARTYVDRLIALARANAIPAQYGVTGGGNDGAAFLRHGAVDIPISWPLRYSHSPGEVVDTRDVEALARIVAAISRSW